MLRALLILMICVFVDACNSRSTPVQSQLTQLKNPSGAQHNLTIDLTIPLSLEPETDKEIFDESVVFSPNFAINQNDVGLSDLFSNEGISNLCFPAALSEVLIYLFGYHQPRFDRLQLDGVSGDHTSISPNNLVHQLAQNCNTEANSGTSPLNAIKCTTQILTQSGYGSGSTKLISPFTSDLTLPIEKREVTIQDIRDGLKGGFPLVLEAAWFVFDSSSKSWVRHSGHYISVFGFDYNKSWGENQIQVKVVNPESNYPSSRKSALWDTVTITRVSKQHGVTYPAGRPYILSGSGFGGLTKRGFLGMLLSVEPSLAR